MRRDDDGVQCHLCGRWFKLVGGSHLIAAHDMTIAEYREMFRLNINVSTSAPELSARKRKSMLEQFASGSAIGRSKSALARQPSAAGDPSLFSHQDSLPRSTARAIPGLTRTRSDRTRHDGSGGSAGSVATNGAPHPTRE
jgi:hypothetical protein